MFSSLLRSPARRALARRGEAGHVLLQDRNAAENRYGLHAALRGVDDADNREYTENEYQKAYQARYDQRQHRADGAQYIDRHLRNNIQDDLQNQKDKPLIRVIPGKTVVLCREDRDQHQNGEIRKDRHSLFHLRVGQIDLRVGILVALLLVGRLGLITALLPVLRRGLLSVLGCRLLHVLPGWLTRILLGLLLVLLVLLLLRLPVLGCGLLLILLWRRLVLRHRLLPVLLKRLLLVLRCRRLLVLLGCLLLPKLRRLLKLLRLLRILVFWLLSGLLWLLLYLRLIPLRCGVRGGRCSRHNRLRCGRLRHRRGLCYARCSRHRSATSRAKFCVVQVCAAVLTKCHL